MPAGWSGTPLTVRVTPSGVVKLTDTLAVMLSAIGQAGSPSCTLRSMASPGRSTVPFAQTAESFSCAVVSSARLSVTLSLRLLFTSSETMRAPWSLRLCTTLRLSPPSLP